jgi:hypothetical protein
MNFDTILTVAHTTLACGSSNNAEIFSRCGTINSGECRSTHSRTTITRRRTASLLSHSSKVSIAKQ